MVCSGRCPHWKRRTPAKAFPVARPTIASYLLLRSADRVSCPAFDSTVDIAVPGKCRQRIKYRFGDFDNSALAGVSERVLESHAALDFASGNSAETGNVSC